MKHTLRADNRTLLAQFKDNIQKHYDEFGEQAISNLNLLEWLDPIVAKQGQRITRDGSRSQSNQAKKGYWNT